MHPSNWHVRVHVQKRRQSIICGGKINAPLELWGGKRVGYRLAAQWTDLWITSITSAPLHQLFPH